MIYNVCFTLQVCKIKVGTDSTYAVRRGRKKITSIGYTKNTQIHGNAHTYLQNFMHTTLFFQVLVILWSRVHCAWDTLLVWRATDSPKHWHAGWELYLSVMWFESVEYIGRITIFCCKADGLRVCVEGRLFDRFIRRCLTEELVDSSVTLSSCSRLLLLLLPLLPSPPLPPLLITLLLVVLLSILLLLLLASTRETLRCSSNALRVDISLKKESGYKLCRQQGNACESIRLILEMLTCAIDSKICCWFDIHGVSLLPVDCAEPSYLLQNSSFGVSVETKHEADKFCDNTPTIIFKPSPSTFEKHRYGFQNTSIPYCKISCYRAVPFCFRATANSALGLHLCGLGDKRLIVDADYIDDKTRWWYQPNQ